MGERVLVVLRVDPESYQDIMVRVIRAGQGDRVRRDGRISLDEVAIEPDPDVAPRSRKESE